MPSISYTMGSEIKFAKFSIETDADGIFLLITVIYKSGCKCLYEARVDMDALEDQCTYWNECNLRRNLFGVCHPHLIKDLFAISGGAIEEYRIPGTYESMRDVECCGEDIVLVVIGGIIRSLCFVLREKKWR